MVVLSRRLMSNQREQQAALEQLHRHQQRRFLQHQQQSRRHQQRRFRRNQCSHRRLVRVSFLQRSRLRKPFLPYRRNLR